MEIFYVQFMILLSVCAAIFHLHCLSVADFLAYSLLVRCQIDIMGVNGIPLAR